MGRFYLEYFMKKFASQNFACWLITINVKTLRKFDWAIFEGVMAIPFSTSETLLKCLAQHVYMFNSIS